MAVLVPPLERVWRRILAARGLWSLSMEEAEMEEEENDGSEGDEDERVSNTTDTAGARVARWEA